jgi:hypothetical protein
VKEPAHPSPLTPEEQRLVRLLRQGPQSLTTLAQAMPMSEQRLEALVRSLDGKVGLVRLFRSGTLCYGLAE